ncbi:hypothetical protein A4S05_21115 [Nostoc sp. KVJ20]|nr:hypothetical protein A4S05_21115 [Nostoc sp. KVJ20]
MLAWLGLAWLGLAWLVNPFASWVLAVRFPYPYAYQYKSDTVFCQCLTVIYHYLTVLNQYMALIIM